MQRGNTFEQLQQTLGKDNEAECLPAATAAVWGAFLHEGLMDSIGNPRDQAILGQWKLGCIELMQATCAYLPDVWDELYRHWDSQERYCGVFEYEVISVLGNYLGDHIILNQGTLPPKAEVEAMIQTLVYCFLESAAQQAKVG